MIKSRILVLGGGNPELGKAVAELLKSLEQVLVVDKASNIFEIRIPNHYHEEIETNYTPNREHGWYRKFEKNSKNRNFKGSM